MEATVTTTYALLTVDGFKLRVVSRVSVEIICYQPSEARTDLTHSERAETIIPRQTGRMSFIYPGRLQNGSWLSLGVSISLLPLSHSFVAHLREESIQSASEMQVYASKYITRTESTNTREWIGYQRSGENWGAGTALILRGRRCSRDWWAGPRHAGLLYRFKSRERNRRFLPIGLRNRGQPGWGEREWARENEPHSRVSPATLIQFLLVSKRARALVPLWRERPSQRQRANMRGSEKERGDSEDKERG